METRNKTPGSDVGARSHPGAEPTNDPARARNELKQQGQAIRDEARSAGQQIKSTASEAGRQAKQKASEVAQQTQRKAAEYARQAQSQGKAMLDQQRHRAAEQVRTVGEAAHRAADKFREENDDNIAGYIDAAADEVLRLGNYLEGRDLNSLWRDAQSFGRRRPEWFLGGMFVAGLALTRFLKASAERNESSYESEQHYGGHEGNRGDPASLAYTGTPGNRPADRAKFPDPSQATQHFTAATDTTGAACSPGMSGMPSSNPSTTTPGLSVPSANPSSPGMA